MILFLWTYSLQPLGSPSVMYEVTRHAFLYCSSPICMLSYTNKLLIHHGLVPDSCNLCWWCDGDGWFRENKGGWDGTCGCYRGQCFGYFWRQYGIQRCSCLAFSAGGFDSLVPPIVLFVFFSSMSAFASHMQFKQRELSCNLSNTKNLKEILNLLDL